MGDNIKPFFLNDVKRKDAFFAVLSSWVGTPYRRNCGIKGRGADCALFLAEALREYGILTTVEAPKYLPSDWHVHGNTEVFLRSMANHFSHLRSGLKAKVVKEENFAFGDWLIFRVSQKRLANHSAIYIGNGDIVHSTEKIGVHIAPLRYWEKYIYRAYRLCEE